MAVPAWATRDETLTWDGTFEAPLAFFPLLSCPLGLARECLCLEVIESRGIDVLEVSS